MEANDKRRILLWGEKSLENNLDQPQVLERVARILLESDDKDKSERALKYARKYRRERARPDEGCARESASEGAVL